MAEEQKSDGVDDVNDRLELEVRRILSSEVIAHRAYLEGLLNQLKWAAGAIAIVATGIFLYFSGKTYNDITEQSRNLVDTKMTEFRINDELHTELRKTIAAFIDSPTTEVILKDSIQQKVKVLVATEAEGSIQKVIAKKADELQIRDFAKHIVSLPVGSVVASMLPPDIFSQVAGDSSPFDPKKSLWAAADGRGIQGSTYSQLLSETKIPDLRGLFLRGLNQFDGTVTPRIDGNTDPDDPQNTRHAGEAEPESVGPHDHPILKSSVDLNLNAALWVGNSSRFPSQIADVYATSPQLKTGINAGRETRPKNAGLYYYIRIN